jgi:FAD/FMN-containing dehydrogenase
MSETLPPGRIEAFAAIVGARNALTGAADIAPFSVEPRGLYCRPASLVLRPGSVAEVSAILKLASQTRTPIIPQGGNTGLVGGQVPATGGEIILSLSRLNAVRALDPVSNTMVAEAGVVLQAARDAADAADRLFPLALGSQGSCQIGGNLSSNAGGTQVLAYGNARELCLGLEVVLPTGEVLDDLRRLAKDNTGYDLKNLFVGAEGTLGIITAAVLKMFPKPKGKAVAWVGLKTPADALALFNRARAIAGGALTGFELMQRRALEFALAYMPELRDPLPDTWPWYVLIDISSGRSQEDARELAEIILAGGIEDGFAGNAAIAASLAQERAFWRLREDISEAQRPAGGSIKHDISVPVEAIPEFIERAAPVVESIVPGARVVCFGHMGDGNLHYNVSQPVGADKQAYLAKWGEMNHAIHGLVIEMHGSISAEHGIGQLKREELAQTAPPVALELMRRIKAAFDPAGIMNPGKVI